MIFGQSLYYYKTLDDVIVTTSCVLCVYQLHVTKVITQNFYQQVIIEFFIPSLLYDCVGSYVGGLLVASFPVSPIFSMHARKEEGGAWYPKSRA